MTILSQVTSVPGNLFWLDGDDENDYVAWQNVWERTRSRRPHDHPGFLQAMRPEGYVPTAVYYEPSPGILVFYAFYALDLSTLPFYQTDSEPLLHLVSPYGYGGPLYEGPCDSRQAISKKFEECFTNEAARRGVVSEFVREDIFQERLVLRNCGEHYQQQPNVIVRLNRSAEQIWQDYHPKVRKNVTRAQKHELRVIFDNSGAYLDQFMSIYHETMTRTGAAKSFFMDKTNFELLHRTLGTTNGITYVHVFSGEQVISTELLLLSTDTIYSFLGGTLSTEFDKRPNDFLKHEVIKWGKQNGYNFFVLGGGITPGDGIFIYKNSFDPGNIVPFFVRKVLYRPDKYDVLTARRQQYEEAQGNTWQPQSRFFPAYLS